MESWEFELEFWIWDNYERQLAKARGVDVRTEEYSTNPEDFKEQLAEFSKETDGKFNPDEWIEVTEG